MLALAWPMILTNLAQAAMTATDVMIIGRLGGEALAAGALGSNLYFAPLIFGLGLAYATQPMMAAELGRREAVSFGPDNREVGELIGRHDLRPRPRAGGQDNLDRRASLDDVVVRDDHPVLAPDHSAPLALLHDHGHDRR